MHNLILMIAYVIATITALMNLTNARSTLGFFLLWLPLSAVYLVGVHMLAVMYWTSMAAFCVSLLGLVAAAIYGVATDEG